MKLSHKASMLMSAVGMGILLMALTVLSAINERHALSSGITTLSTLSLEIANNIENRLQDKAEISTAFSSSNSVTTALLESNKYYASIPEHQRNKQIMILNDRWQNISEKNNPFILERTNNKLSDYFKQQQTNTPGFYGEIFLTNKFGVMIASTEKLTTLAHAHKYWWIEAFNNGKGKIFFDDRGYDESVGDYVLGIVIPIKKNGQIIGILKSNIRVLNLLQQVIKNHEGGNQGHVQIARSGGLIIMSQGLEPLSHRLSDAVVKNLRKNAESVTYYSDDGTNKIVSGAPITITTSSGQYGFGGATGSIDHSKGNPDEGWHVIISQNRDEMLRPAYASHMQLLAVGIVFTAIIAFTALLSGNIIARPLTALAERAKTIGQGGFDEIVNVYSNDEIGSLAKSFNKMTVDLKNTMISRDALHKESEKRRGLNNLLLESVIEGVFGLDMQGRLTFINTAAAHMLGYNRNELIDKPICAIISQDQNNGEFCRRTGCAIHNKPSTNKNTSSSNETLWRKDGSSFPAEYSTRPIYQNANIIGAVITFRDTSERDAAEANATLLQRQLQQSQKMEAIGKLTGGVAHDFNNMLSAILGYAHLALDACSKRKDGEIDNYLAEVVSAGERSRDLVRQMMIFSRNEKVDAKRINLNRVTHDVLRMLRATIPSSIQLQESIPEHTIYVDSNSIQLDQVIMNLVINARDAIEGQVGSIEIGISDANLHHGYCSSCHKHFDNSYVTIYVRDSGSGIPEDVIDNIFDPFYTTKGIGEGTGMGLSMVHGIIHSSNGHIQLETRMGEGTTIYLHLPKAISPEIINSDHHANHSHEEISRQGHIMVVDDEKILANLITIQLSDAGYTVDTFTNPKEALKQFKSNPDQYDLLITDQTMPHLNGNELASAAMTIRNDIPVILATGYSLKINEGEALKMGIAKYLEKPLNRNELLATIEQLLTHKSDTSHRPG